MTDGALIDQERIVQQHAAGPNPAKDFGKQPPVEEIDADDIIDGGWSKARAVEIDLRGIDRRRSLAQRLQRPP